MLYLLHFAQPVGDKLHYLGCCHDDRLRQRLAEHAALRGSNLTARAFRARVPVYLARVFPQLGFAEEKLVKKGSHFKRLCPLCCPVFQHLAVDAYEVKPRPEAEPPKFAVWDWRDTAPLAGTLNKQKGPT